MSAPVHHPKLGPSELKTLHDLRAEGWGYRRIAHVLAVHYLTVKYHVKHVERAKADPQPTLYRCRCGGASDAPEGHPRCQEAA